jgi:hypothetical protein
MPEIISGEWVFPEMQPVERRLWLRRDPRTTGGRVEQRGNGGEGRPRAPQKIEGPASASYAKAGSGFGWPP